MSFTVPYLSLRGGLLLLTAASLSFSSPHTAISGVSSAATVCSPSEAALRRDLQEAQKRFASLRVKNFQLRQQLLRAEMQRDMAKAQLWAVRDKSVVGDVGDLTSTDIMSVSIRQQLEPPVQVPLRSAEK
ncbi:TPA: hypothetical protein QCI16_000240 [Enterobacter ludwigii]|uniref:hypothetical protein n=1 Tax=Enterobacter ludwigii TaxID=299767 RepID=UPI0032F23571|nr:hypothetical protein [Enterobacter ludwigii]HDR2596128.1 hypothetical protein [Enterobacter ludwigii]